MSLNKYLFTDAQQFNNVVNAVNQEVNVCLLELSLALCLLYELFMQEAHENRIVLFIFLKNIISVFLPSFLQRCVIYICAFFFRSFEGPCGNLCRVIEGCAEKVHLGAILSIVCLREISAVVGFHSSQVHLTQIQSERAEKTRSARVKIHTSELSKVANT